MNDTSGRLNDMSGSIEWIRLEGWPRSHLGQIWTRFGAPRPKIRRSRLILRLGAGLPDMCAGILDISARTAGYADDLETGWARTRSNKSADPEVRRGVTRRVVSYGLTWVS